MTLLESLQILTQSRCPWSGLFTTFPVNERRWLHHIKKYPHTKKKKFSSYLIVNDTSKFCSFHLALNWDTIPEINNEGIRIKVVISSLVWTNGLDSAHYWVFDVKIVIIRAVTYSTNVLFECKFLRIYDMIEILYLVNTNFCKKELEYKNHKRLLQIL